MPKKTLSPARSAPARVVNAPPLPMSMQDFYKLSSSEKARVREFHGENVEADLEREFHAKLKIENARKGVSYEQGHDRS